MELTLYHWLILVAAFLGLIWGFRKKNKARFDNDARIPFEDDKKNDKLHYE